MGRTEERGEPRTGVDRPSPGMRETHAGKLRETREELFREFQERLRALVEIGVQLSPVRIDRVVSAPQDPVVRGKPEVMELIGTVTEPLAPLPADRFQLRGGERLGHQRVVVDRHGVRPDALDQRGEDVGAERDTAGEDAPVRGADRHPLPRAGELQAAGVLVDPYAQLPAGPLQTPGELRRVQHRDPAPIPEAAEEGGRVDLGPQRVAVEEVHARDAELHDLLVPFPQLLELVGLGGDVDLTGALELAVDAVAGDGGLDGVEVPLPQLLQLRDLVGPALHAVGQPVGEGGGAETAVAARGGPAHLVPLDEDDVPVRIALLGDERGPQTAVAPADDQQVGVLVAGEGGERVGPLRIVEPERDRLDAGKG